ncbi:MAG: hypothetical protein E6R12_10155 [Sphingomonadales bacterium]|nr:MAG: hypothetical protein E6R12_10155 [Sphingomonadales bacterium]
MIDRSLGSGCKRGVERKLFFGSHLNGVDGKNRLSIPSDFRDVAQSNCGQRTLLVYEHESLPCLVASDLNFVECLRARRQSEVGERYGAAREDISRSLFGLAEPVNYDDTGRIVLDPDLKQAVGINGLAFLIGIEDYFEIWNPYSFLREKGAGDHRLARKIRQKLAQKGEPMPEDLPA